MSYSKKILNNTIFNWSSLILSLVVSFFLAPFILRKIGNNYYGIWALVSQVTGYLWLLDFGVRESLVKYVAEYHTKKNESMVHDVVNASLLMYTVICLACIILTILFSILAPQFFNVTQEQKFTVRVLTIIAGLDIAQAFVFNVFIGIIMGIQRYDLFSKVVMALALLRAFFTVVFLSYGYGIITLCLLQFIGNSIMNIVLFFLSRRLLPVKLDLKIINDKIAVYKMLFNFSIFAFLNSIGAQAIFYSANFIIAAYLPVSYVTYFFIASSLVDYMKKLIISGTQAFSPLTSELDAKNDVNKIANLLIQGTKLSLILGFPIAIVYLFLGGTFINLWMGSEYAKISGEILSILTVMTIFSLPHFTVSGILFGLNKHYIIAYCRIAEGIVNICLSVMLTKHYGLVGAAFGAAIPHLVVVVFILPIVISKIVKIKLSKYIKAAYLKPILLAIPFSFSCYLSLYYYAPHTLFAFFSEIIILLPFYLVPLWLFGIDKNERKKIKDLLATAVRRKKVTI